MLNIANHWRNVNQNHNEYHLTPAKMATITKSINNNIRQDMEKRERLYALGGNLNWYSHYGKQCGVSKKTKKKDCHMIQQFHAWVYT